MIEVEVKCQVPPTAWPQLQAQLETMHLIQQVHNVDTYYDTVDCDLLRQAVFVRVRNQRYLEFKWNPQVAAAHIQCQEATFPLEPDARQAAAMNALFRQFLPNWRGAQTVAEALHSNGLVSLAAIDNQRLQYARNELHLCVDQVDGLGNFVEIEILCEKEYDTSFAEKRILALAEQLAARRVRVGYVELWLQKYDLRAYQLGRYHEQ